MSSPSPPRARMFLIRWFIFALLGLIGWWLLSSRTGLPAVPPQVQAGETALKSKDTAKAMQQFDAAVKNDSTNPILYLQICQVCANQKNMDLLMHYGDAAVNACKDLPRSARAALYMSLAQCYADVETVPNQTKALEAAQRAFELNPDDPDIMNGYGYILADNDQKLDEAVPILRRALDLQRKQLNTPDTQFKVAQTEDSYGWALYKQGKYADAVNAISQALTDVPEAIPGGEAEEGELLKVLYYHQGAAFHKAGRIPEARHALLSALRYDPAYAPAKAELDSLPPETPPAVKPPTGADSKSPDKPANDNKTSVTTNARP